MTSRPPLIPTAYKPTRGIAESSSNDMAYAPPFVHHSYDSSLSWMPGHQLVRVHPAGKRAYALQPGADTRVIRPADAELIGPVEIPAQGEIGNGRFVADSEASILQMRIQDAQRGLHAPAQEVVHLRLADFRQVHHVAQRGNVAGESVVVPEHPAQDLASLVLVAAGEFAEVRGKVMQDHA